MPSTSAGITVTNGTLVSYDNTTGVIVVSGDDTTSVSCECPTAPSGYAITLSFVGNATPARVNVEINGVIQNDWANGETKVYTNVETLNIGIASGGSVALGNKTGSLANY